MELTKAPNGHLQIDGARICYRNFAGVAKEYNEAGERNFSLIIPDQELAQDLIDDGWKVIVKEPRDPDDSPFIHMPVKVRFGANGIPAYLISGRARIALDEHTISRLDKIQIERVDLDIRPFDWKKGNRSGRAAYLHAIRVYQKIDRFTAEYEAEERYESF
jgi:hypothetical protein